MGAEAGGSSGEEKSPSVTDTMKECKCTESGEWKAIRVSQPTTLILTM
jgi:hypothetical protein